MLATNLSSVFHAYKLENCTQQQSAYDKRVFTESSKNYFCMCNKHEKELWSCQ